MNTIDFYDEAFRATDTYNNFIKENPLNAMLNIRASGASVALPVSGVKIIVSKEIDNYKVIFYEGYTDESGMINKISLPAPKVNTNDLLVPIGTSYDIEAIYEKDNLDRKYQVIMYPDICTVQNINIVPTLNVGGFFYGS